jgi:hypothetical protein
MCSAGTMPHDSKRHETTIRRVLFRPEKNSDGLVARTKWVPSTIREVITSCTLDQGLPAEHSINAAVPVPFVDMHSTTEESSFGASLVRQCAFSLS